MHTDTPNTLTIYYWTFEASNYVCTFQDGFEFQKRYEDIFNRSMSPPLNLSVPSIYAQQCYDATWTLAKALNLTISGTIVVFGQIMYS